MFPFPCYIYYTLLFYLIRYAKISRQVGELEKEQAVGWRGETGAPHASSRHAHQVQRARGEL